MASGRGRHLPLIAVFVLGPASLAAQSPRIGPDPSPLFARTYPSDSTPKPHLMSVEAGAGLGATTGVALGVIFGVVQSRVHPCSCDDPGLEPIVGAFLGGIIGGVVGASIADERIQRARGRRDPSPGSPEVTENGTPLTAHSLRLVGRDRHGVRGGIAGALIGGVAGYATAHGVYALEHGGGFTTSAGKGSPSTVAVGVSTLTGAISGYLIAAMLSRR